MIRNLLASKFYFPPHRPDLVPRQGLLENLDAGLAGKLTLVSAPAGFGKTTVVSEWLRHAGRPAAWLSVDKNDNDLSRFLIYLIAAIQRIDSQIGVDIQAALEESPSPHFDILLTRLISELENFSHKSIIVLDDYHLINSKQVHDSINFLIEFLPPVIHLVISGRTDPPLPISRLRVRGDVNEVRTPQLRFTLDEVTTYLNHLLGFDLSSDGIAALETRTEGWIASLKLAALSMQGRDDWPEFITKFSGSNRYIIDYLVDEVMARQPGEVQAFLRRTSILERFCAALCNDVAGETQDVDILDYLDRSNLFLIPLDDQKEWYRYHHLFADFLNQRLRESEPDRIPELHRRASQWYHQAGLVDEAIQHALAAGDVDSAISLVDQVAMDLIIRRESNKLLRLMDQLPPDRCRDYPMLCIWHAWALVFLGQLEAVEPTLQIVETSQSNVPGLPIHAYVTTVRAFLANMQGDIRKSLHLTEQALDELSAASPDRITRIFQGSAIIWLGVNHRNLGNLDKARQRFLESARLNQATGNLYAAVASFEQLAKLAVICGQLHQAIEVFQSGLKVAQSWTDQGGKHHGTLIAVAGLQLGLGAVYYQINDLDLATTHIQRSADLLELGELWSRIDSYRMLAYLRQAQGEFAASAELVNKIYAIEDTLLVQPTKTTDLPSLAQLGILLSRLRPEMAHLFSQTCQRIEELGVCVHDEVDFSSPTGYLSEFNYSDLACLLIAQDRGAEALPLLTRLLEAAIAMGRHGDEIRYLVMIAMVHAALGNEQTAQDFLGHALTQAEPQGYVRLFIDEGQPMAELLRAAISHNISPGYAGKLLDAFPKDVLDAIPVGNARSFNQSNMVEPLSQREIEVLHLMAEGYAYKEIADRLVVSINTVRYHTRNVYGKLSVNNRTQAISRAKELSLL